MLGQEKYLLPPRLENRMFNIHLIEAVWLKMFAGRVDLCDLTVRHNHASNEEVEMIRGVMNVYEKVVLSASHFRTDKSLGLLYQLVIICHSKVLRETGSSHPPIRPMRIRLLLKRLLRVGRDRDNCRLPTLALNSVPPWLSRFGFNLSFRGRRPIASNWTLHLLTLPRTELYFLYGIEVHDSKRVKNSAGYSCIRRKR